MLYGSCQAFRQKTIARVLGGSLLTREIFVVRKDVRWVGSLITNKYTKMWLAGLVKSHVSE